MTHAEIKLGLFGTRWQVSSIGIWICRFRSRWVVTRSARVRSFATADAASRAMTPGAHKRNTICIYVWSSPLCIWLTRVLAANWAALGICYNTGQDCTAGSRVYVQDTVYDKFMQILVSRVKATVIGDGFDDSVGGGPVVSKTQYDRVWSYIESGKAEGAKVVLGGEKRPGKGFFVDPTSASAAIPAFHSRILKCYRHSFCWDPPGYENRRFIFLTTDSNCDWYAET
jgi:hypothetical protein